jgi:hypothetical protein
MTLQSVSVCGRAWAECESLLAYPEASAWPETAWPKAIKLPSGARSKKFALGVGLVDGAMDVAIGEKCRAWD